MSLLEGEQLEILIFLNICSLRLLKLAEPLQHFRTSLQDSFLTFLMFGVEIIGLFEPQMEIQNRQTKNLQIPSTPLF